MKFSVFYQDTEGAMAYTPLRPDQEDVANALSYPTAYGTTFKSSRGSNKGTKVTGGSKSDPTLNRSNPSEAPTPVQGSASWRGPGDSPDTLKKIDSTADRLANPTHFVVPGKAKLLDDKVEKDFADRLENPVIYTVPGKAKLKDDAVEEHFGNLLENPSKHTVNLKASTASLMNEHLGEATQAGSGSTSDDEAV